jgi:hypothetical protein
LDRGIGDAGQIDRLATLILGCRRASGDQGKTEEKDYYCKHSGPHDWLLSFAVELPVPAPYRRTFPGTSTELRKQRIAGGTTQNYVDADERLFWW